MTKEEYQNNRVSLLEAAQALITEGKIEDAEAKMQEVTDLDEQWEGIKLASANLNALKDNQIILNLAGESVNVEGEKTVANIQEVKPANEQEVYKLAWAKQMMGQALEDSEKVIFDQVQSKFSNAVQTTGNQAIVIPESVVNNIWREAADLFPILGAYSATYVPGDLTLLKEVNSGAEGEWMDESDQPAEGAVEIGELNLTGCELAKSVTVSWKLRKMSIDQFIPYITTLIAEKVGAALARAIVSGKGKPAQGDNSFKAQPRGILTALLAEAGTPQVVAYEDLGYDHIAQAMGKLKSAYKSGASVYAKADTIWNQLALIKDNDGRPIFVPNVEAGGVGRLFGVPVKEDDSIPAGGILIANVARGYAINFNETMSVYTEDHVKARTTDYMSYSIVDGDVLTNKAFAYITDAPAV